MENEGGGGDGGCGHSCLETLRKAENDKKDTKKNLERYLWKNYTDKLFDPWDGVFSNTVRHDDLDMLWFAIDDLYMSLDIDFDLAAMNGESNPLTFDDVNNTETTYMAVPPLLLRANHYPYQIFLAQLGIPHDIHDHVTNYEPQYLAALMKYHPRELDIAKQEYMRLYPDAYMELIQDWGPGPLGPE